MEHPLVTFETALVDALPDAPCIIATGPLTDPALTKALSALPGLRELHFFDAAAPIVAAESIDMDKVFRASRYEKGSDYLNCPMTEAEYNAFYDALVGAELAEVHDFEKKLVFEGCLAVEILASRGRQTLAFGPLKPVGLADPHTGKEPYAVVQLRQENEQGTLYGLVGFQTRLKWGEQKRVFSMIPGLEHAEFVRYGVMHRNTFLRSPDILSRNYALDGQPLFRFAGQLTGVEGYMESAASGMVAAIGLCKALRGEEEPDFGGQTVLGALERHVRTPSADFQPMNANFGILDRAAHARQGQAQPLRQTLRARAGSARRDHRPIRIEELTMAESIFRGTTICAVRKNGECAMAGDGQVTMGQQTVMKAHAHKVRRIYNGKVVVGFAGSVADAFALSEKFEEKLTQFSGNLPRAAVELAQDWRMDKAMRKLEAMLLCADKDNLLLVSGTGEVIEPDDGVLTIGSGGNYALAAARALMQNTDLPAREIAERALKIAADICIFTNGNIIVETV